MRVIPVILAVAVSGGAAFAQVTPGTVGPATTAPTPATTPAPNPMPGRPVIPGTNTPVPGSTTGTPAQLNGGNNSSTTPPAVTTSNADNKTSAAPVKGRNSFTMGEARRRLERGGFTQVTGLKKDQDGIWRGKGHKGGQEVNVYCDYQGNVGAS